MDLAAEPIDSDKDKGVLRLADSEPIRFSQAQLHELWKEALKALQSQAQARPGTKPSGHRPVPIGPYNWRSSPRSAVAPPVKSRSRACVTNRSSSQRPRSVPRAQARRRSLPSGLLR